MSFELQRGRTVVGSAEARSPLRLLTPRNHGHAAWTYLSSFGGGLVDGDAITLSVEVKPGACAFVSTQGATRAYRSRAGVSNEVRASVGADALLAMVPDPVSPFAGARLRQSAEVELDARGSVVLVDVINAGRVAMGERWAFDQARSRVALRRDGRVLADETLLLDPAAGRLCDRLRPFEAFATVVMAGPRVAKFAQAAAAQIGSGPREKRPSLLQAASPIADGAWWFRLASNRADPLRLRMLELLSFLPSLLGDDPFARRP